METHKKTVLIAGGCEGFGLELAEYFSDENVRIIVTANVISDLMATVYRDRNLIALAVDLSMNDGVSQLISYLDFHAFQIDLFVNNAGNAYLKTREFLYENNREKAVANYLSGISVVSELLERMENGQLLYADFAQIPNVGNIGNTNSETIKKSIGSFLDILRYGSENVIFIGYKDSENYVDSIKNHWNKTAIPTKRIARFEDDATAIFLSA